MQPIGVDFSVVIDGEKQTYHIKPDVFSEATMSRLTAYMKAKRSENRRELLRDISDASKGLPEASVTAMTTEVIRDGLEKVLVDFETAISVLNSGDSEGLAIALEMNVDGINSRAEARKVMSAYPNVADLTSKVIHSGMTAMEAAAEYDPQSGLGN